VSGDRLCGVDGTKDGTKDGSNGSRAARPSLVDRIRRRYGWLDHAIRAGERYVDTSGDHYAAAVAYFSVFAMVPLLMIGFSVAGFVLFRSPELLDDLEAKVAAAAPPQMASQLSSVVREAVSQRATVGLLGIAVAAYSGLGWMNNLREAVTAQWEDEAPQGSFVRKKGADVLALAGLGLAILLSIGLTAAGTGFTTQLLELVGLADRSWAKVLLVVITVLLALAGNWLVFLWMIARLPRHRVNLRSAARAAVIGAVGFEVLKLAATLVLGKLNGPAGAVFGPVIGVLLFAYLAARLILYVAAWAATSPENHRLVPADVPAAGAVIRPAVTVHRGPDGRTVTGLVGAGTVVGLGLAWLLRRR
jgi:membrane protein